MAASLVIADRRGVQWIQRPTRGRHDGEAGRARRRGFARSIAASETSTPSRSSNRSCGSGRGGRTAASSSAIGQHVDGLAVMPLFLVAFISLLVQIFSLEYVRGDRRYTHFFAAITLFSAGMLVMVLAENMVQLHPRLGDHGPLLVPADRPLVGGRAQRPRRPEGVLHRSCRRRRPARRHGHPLLRVQLVDRGEPRHARLQHPGHLRLGAVRRSEPHGDLLGGGRPVRRLHRQERSVPAAHLVARRHGRPDAGVLAAALVDDGRRRRVPRRPPVPRVLGGLRDPGRRASTSSS